MFLDYEPLWAGLFLFHIGTLIALKCFISSGCSVLEVYWVHLLAFDPLEGTFDCKDGRSRASVQLNKIQLPMMFRTQGGASCCGNPWDQRPHLLLRHCPTWAALGIMYLSARKPWKWASSNAQRGEPWSALILPSGGFSHGRIPESEWLMEVNSTGSACQVHSGVT